MEFRLPSINKVSIVGNLLSDPESNFVTDKKISVVNFKIASNKKFKTNSGEKKDKVCYVNIVAWAKLADVCSENLRKGDGVYVEGELQTRVINYQTGDKISVLEVLANKVQFLTKKQYSTEIENSNEQEISSF